MATDTGALGLTPTEDTGERLTDSPVWDEQSRPHPPPAGPVSYTSRGRAAAESLLTVHTELRDQLAEIRALVGQVTAGDRTVAQARAALNDMAIRQNNWTLGAYCASYCTLVAAHHLGEDTEIFPYLRQRDAALQPVLNRLTEEHHVIHDLLEGIDRALVGLVEGASTPAAVGRSVDALTDALLSHLAYEEAQLLEPMARHFG